MDFTFNTTDHGGWILPLFRDASPDQTGFYHSASVALVVLLAALAVSVTLILVLRFAEPQLTAKSATAIGALVVLTIVATAWGSIFLLPNAKAQADAYEAPYTRLTNGIERAYGVELIPSSVEHSASQATIEDAEATGNAVYSKRVVISGQPDTDARLLFSQGTVRLMLREQWGRGGFHEAPKVAQQ